MASIDSRPFYGTLWFSLLATALMVVALFFTATSMPDIEGRPVTSIGHFGVVLIAAYWLVVFPKLRKIRKKPDASTAQGEQNPQPK